MSGKRDSRANRPQRVDPHPLWQRIAFGFVTLNGALAAGWFAAYYLMEWAYGTFGGAKAVEEPSLLRQFLTVWLAVFLLFNAINLFRLLFAPQKRFQSIFEQMNDAMRRLVQGDFTGVTMKTDPKQMGQFALLVDNFNDMAKQLSEIESMRQEFVSNVSHEIQSPLTSIGGFARALRSGDLSSETRAHYLDIIETETARLSKLSDNLLKLASLESSHHPFERKSYRLDRQLRHVVLSLEPLWTEKNLELDVDLSAFTIHADEELLSHVWINLLHNAIKFTPAGGTISIRLTIEQDRGVRIIVEDNGCGIEEAHLPHLFERFYKVDKARTRSQGGSGLGLSIVRRIVDMHGGEITASSRPSEGSSFEVRLPVSK